MNVPELIQFIRDMHLAEGHPAPYSGFWWDQDRMIQEIARLTHSDKSDLNLFQLMLLRRETNETSIRDSLPRNNEKVMHFIYDFCGF
jgi:hypothetical protein